MHSALFSFLALLATWEACWCSPIPIHTVDLTHVFDNTTIHVMIRKFEMNGSVLEIPNTDFSAKVEEFSVSTHVGTHIDAPCHVSLERDTLDDIPMEKLMAPAAVLDVKEDVAANSDYEVQIRDLLQWENKTQHLLNEVILLIRTGWSKHWPNRTAYVGKDDNTVGDWHFPGISPSAARWLVANRKVYGVGVESISTDHGPSKDFPVHRILADNDIYGLENLGNMDEVPLFGASLYVMPMKLGGACGSPCRIVATFPDVIYG